MDLLDSTGIRQGEALGLMRQDQHFLADNTELLCAVRGPHIHVRRRAGLENGALAKDFRGRHVPVPADVVMSWWAYDAERFDLVGADDNPHVFVNLWGPLPHRGRAMRAWAVQEVFKDRISAQLGIRVRAHMLRHTRATIWVNGLDGGTPLPLIEVQELMGHASLQTTRGYLHTDRQRLRKASQAALLRPQAALR